MRHKEFKEVCKLILKNRSEATTEEKKKIDAWLDEQMDE